MAAPDELPFRIQVLRRLNPLVSCLLQSRLHKLASRRLLVLQYRGRRTHRQYTIPLAYTMHAGQAYCCTRNTQWWKSAIAAESITVWLRGLPLDVHAERVPVEDDAARGAFARFLTENPRTATLLYNVRIARDGTPDADDLTRELPNSHVIRLTDVDRSRVGSRRGGC